MKRRLWVYVGATMVVAIVLASAAAVWSLHRHGDRTNSSAAGPVAARHSTVAPPVESYPLHHYRLTLPLHPKVVAVGDAMMAGTGAVPIWNGYIYLVAREMSWNVEVLPDGRGTGFLGGNAATHMGTFQQQIAVQHADPSVSLVVLQASANDVVPASDSEKYNLAIDEAVAVIRTKYPKAQIVALGLLPSRTSTVMLVDRLDSRFAYEADQVGIDYMSPVEEHWLATSQLSDYIDPKRSYRPNNAGHAYIASKFIADVRKLSE